MTQCTCAFWLASLSQRKVRIDDYLYECLWNSPDKYLPLLRLEVTAISNPKFPLKESRSKSDERFQRELRD